MACELFRRENLQRTAATIITQVLVNEGDPDLVHPSKPIGQFYGADEIERIRADRPHWEMREMEAGRWRRVVASPRPLRIIESDAIDCLLDAGILVIAAGGGGIPVAWEGPRLVGVEGVIDKDLVSSLLARDLHAHKLIIVTSVDRVAVRFGRPDQRGWIPSQCSRLASTWRRASFRRGRWGPRSKPP